MNELSRPRIRGTQQDPEFGPWLAQASILIIDDEPGMRNFLSRTIGPRCKKLEEAASAEEASRKLDSQYFDVVILDNILPGKTGVRWLAEQRASGFFFNAILITAYADLETAIQALQAGRWISSCRGIADAYGARLSWACPCCFGPARYSSNAGEGRDDARRA